MNDKMIVKLISEIDWSKGKDGLVPAIVQDSLTSDVLMMAWMNVEALRLTLSSGKVTFF